MSVVQHNGQIQSCGLVVYRLACLNSHVYSRACNSSPFGGFLLLGGEKNVFCSSDFSTQNGGVGLS